MIRNLLVRAAHKPASSGLSTRKWVMYEFLKNNPIGVLSTVSPDGEPHGVVIYFTCNKQLELCFLTKVKTRKYDNLIHNERAMLTVFEPVTQTTIQVMGKVVAINDNSEINSVAQTILKISLKMNPTALPPVAKIEAGPYVAFKIVPVQMRMATYTKPEVDGYRDIFESVESFELETH